MATKTTDTAAQTVEVEVLKGQTHEHKGRTYTEGQTFTVTAHQAEWLEGIGKVKRTGKTGN